MDAVGDDHNPRLRPTRQLHKMFEIGRTGRPSGNEQIPLDGTMRGRGNRTQHQHKTHRRFPESHEAILLNPDADGESGEAGDP